MADSEEETVKDLKGLRKFGIACGVRFASGVVLIIIGAVAAGVTKSRGIPYFLGAFLTGITMSVSELVSHRNCRNAIRENASSSQKLKFIRIETGISVVAVLTAIPGVILAGVNGVTEPRCRRGGVYGYTVPCQKEPYQSTTIYKLALAIMLLLILSIIINAVFICQGAVFNRPSDKENVTASTTGQQQPLVERTNNQIPGSGSGSTGFVLNTRHGHPEPFAGAILSTNAQQPVLQGNYNNHSENSSTGFVLNTRHGQPEPFAGAVLSTNAQQPMVQGNYSNRLPGSGSGSTGFVLNTRHGQPEPFAGAILSTNTQQPMTQSDYNNRGENSSAGYVLNTHYGQPQPFAGAILSTETQQSALQGLNTLVSELQEQNRLLREQLALQQQRAEPQEQNVTPSAPVSESPPSYESCMTDH
ncbi:uncharacterized protein LOC123556994 [Mercenaria mercenaria]|uniref:uncharacterized protein LOC123556994 n=1 Tax=Mercenaria mercenaria TaxID=6596 RepID=UPI00234E4C40|nr:uncharacterized protein LOC123556994 [Mercenaria mercenaria]